MVEKFCYLGGMFSLYGGASDVDNSGKGSAFKKFRESSRVLAVKQGLSLKYLGKIYKSLVRPVLLYCDETWEFTLADEFRLRGGGVADE